MTSNLSFDDLYNGVWGNESSGSSRAGIWGDGGQAAGPLQVHPAALADVNAAQGTNYTHAQLAADPELGKRIGRDYLRMQYNKFGGDPQLTLAAYNAGPGAVANYVASGQQGPLPAQAYVNAALAKIGGQGVTPSNAGLGQQSASDPTPAMNSLGVNPSWVPPAQASQGDMNSLFQNALMASALKSFRVPVSLTQVDFNPFAAATQQGMNPVK